MKAEHANIFISSAVNVFKKELNIRLERKSLIKKPSPIPSLFTSIIFGITGAVNGQVVYSMDKNFAFKVAQVMLPNMPVEEVKKMENSAVSELANIITGQASIALAEETKKIHLTHPVVLMSADLMMDFLAIPTITLNMISEIGELEINIALVEKE